MAARRLACDNNVLWVDPAPQGVAPEPLQRAFRVTQLGWEAVGGREAVVDGGDSDAVRGEVVEKGKGREAPVACHPASPVDVQYCWRQGGGMGRAGRQIQVQLEGLTSHAGKYHIADHLDLRGREKGVIGAMLGAGGVG